MTVFGNTRTSRPAVLMPPSVRPHTGVISEPEKVVGTARIGSPQSSAMALASPIVEPPPMAMQQSAFRLFAAARRLGGLQRHMHHSLIEDSGDRAASSLRESMRPTPNTTRTGSASKVNSGMAFIIFQLLECARAVRSFRSRSALSSTALGGDVSAHCSACLSAHPVASSASATLCPG